MEKIKCNFIACGPAVGKTYLAEHDSRFIDLDEMKSTYKYGLEKKSRIQKERGKANRGSAVNFDSYEYITKIIDKVILDKKVGMLSFNEKLLKYLLDNNISYCLVYPSKECRLDYIQRMKTRGNNEIFISKMTDLDVWNEFYNKNINDSRAKYKIELEKGKYLSDIKDYFV